jgi:hypothetical protein
MSTLKSDPLISRVFLRFGDDSARIGLKTVGAHAGRCILSNYR